jgi:hypothetical protein
LTIPRSTNAGRGELAGPAPTRRQVRAITVQVVEVRPGVLRLSTPMTPGWVGEATNAMELARLVASAFAENQVAAYAMWRGVPYEHADGTQYRRPRPSRPGHRVDVHDPRAWRVAPDGRWIDPGSGRLWRADSQVVQRVQTRLIALGLDPTPDTVDSASEEDTQ